MADILVTVVRFVHIASAIALIGGATLWGAVIAPTLAQMGSTMPKGLMPTLGGRVAKYLPMAGWGTLLGGVATAAFYWNSWGELWRTIMSIAFVITVVMLATSYALINPTFKRLTTVMSATQGPPPPEAKQLQMKLMKVSMMNLILGWVVVALMVVAVSLHT
jgi:uncharacterized membrane protein